MGPENLYGPIPHAATEPVAQIVVVELVAELVAAALVG